MELLRRIDGGLVIWVVVLIPVIIIAWPEKRLSDWAMLIQVLRDIKEKL
jgi:hypothetical protein